MLEIQTEYGNFGAPRDLLIFMVHKQIENIHVKVLYCLKDVIEKDMNVDEVRRWNETFISPIVGTLEDAIAWLILGLS